MTDTSVAATGDPDPVVASTPSPFVVEPPMTNPEAAVGQGQQFLQQHRAAMGDRTKEIDNLFSKQQLTVDNMSKILDDTAAALKSAHDPGNRSNLPLIALGAGMMGPGNFGTQLGRGLQGMSGAIEKQRGEDDDYQFKLAQLAMRRAGVESAPIEQKIAYMRALQTGDQSAIRAIEAGMIKAQGQTGKQQNQADQNEIKANQNAYKAAQDQVDKLGKDFFSTPQERDAELKKRYQQIARSFKVPEESINEFLKTVPPSYDPAKAKGAFNVPTGGNPQEVETAKNLGVPPLATGSPYASTPNPADRGKLYPAEKSAFDKENKLVIADANKAAQELAGLDQAEKILKEHPEVTGPQYGLPNTLFPNRSKASQSLESIFSNNTIHSVPQGQGAISDYERSLFNKANPSMAHRADVNLELIAQRKRILQDQIQKQAFYQNYFNYHKTGQGADQAWIEYARSPEGRAYAEGKDGLINNPNRIGWKEYFAKKWGDQPQAHARGGQHDGPIHLGDEWDD